MDKETSWKRFSDRHLGAWNGRSTHVDVRTMDQVRLDEYSWTVGETTSSNYEVRVTGSMIGSGWSWELGYRIGSPNFHVFEDGSYCTEHEMVDLEGVPIARLMVEMCLTLSATERLRCLLLYDIESTLKRVILLQEVREELWEERNPSSLLSMVGKWQGQTKSARAPTLGAGIISYDSDAVFLWDATHDSVRESFSATNDGELIDKITNYGKVNEEGDLTAIDWGGREQRRTMLLNCSAFASAPLSLPAGSPWWCEFSCFVTSRCRRRIKRLYDKEGTPVSHSVLTENRLE